MSNFGVTRKRAACREKVAVPRGRKRVLEELVRGSDADTEGTWRGGIMAGWIGQTLLAGKYTHEKECLIADLEGNFAHWRRGQGKRHRQDHEAGSTWANPACPAHRLWDSRGLMERGKKGRCW